MAKTNCAIWILSKDNLWNHGREEENVNRTFLYRRKRYKYDGAVAWDTFRVIKLKINKKNVRCIGYTIRKIVSNRRYVVSPIYS